MVLFLVEDYGGVIRSKGKRVDSGGLEVGAGCLVHCGGRGPGICRVLWFHFPSPTGQHSPWDRPTVMDPTQLSMGQGKDFLKQLGIPQRDVSVGEVGQVTCGGTSWPPSQVLMSPPMTMIRAESPWLATWVCGPWPVAGKRSNQITGQSSPTWGSPAVPVPAAPPGGHHRQTHG